MVTRLERAHINTRQRLSREAQRLIRRAWVAAGGEDEFAAEAAAVTSSARSAVVAEVDAFLATYLTTHGVPSNVRGLDPDVYARPVDPDTEWRRPYKHLRIKLGEGMELPQADAFAGGMAAKMMATDLQYAQMSASRDWMASDGRIPGYRRTLTPSGDNCKLCIAAAGEAWHIDDVNPIHDSCGCTAVPVLGQSVPEPGAFRDRMADEGVAVADHGELGPYLYDVNHSPPLLDAAA